MNPQLAGNYHTSYTPDGAGTHTYIETSDASAWVKYSDIHTIYGTDPAFVNFFDNLAAEWGDESFSLSLGFAYNNMWIVGNSKITGMKSSFGALNDANFMKFQAASVGFSFPDITGIFDDQLESTYKYFSKMRRTFEGRLGLKKLFYPIRTNTSKLLFFASKVGTGSQYDIKQIGKGYSPSELGARFAYYNGELFGYDDFGNYNYGVAAAAFGISLEMGIFAAGVNQIFNRNPDFSNIGGFFDHKQDTEYIKKGYNHDF